ncbi:MAG: type I glyceraldehyde-3-phosphate dehydrogenase [Candidatus Doudnabacteria bacterium RIFCSPLOWO2_02_FULL_48_8]|uniref:Glyceraldehyde-3-phosphate dehydrogenase n=1 Tax=Candidatus Doudnabacteria bacterium RIFCSPHIGHO2_01_FULL_46_24 TaxID=1817825 RepID=A0A1F5NV45_9BACT|nr:MAG: type I glyceraldehyde-3-phosphate dehydrogenase [Candidatus Doudnabacteria bacterium RIFCSPHIGHO2_01_FULL_46_24]OGE95014.1 MAG: type I glyceraldehyde-3-phosphate dehydrogenase [Candidatus Doudnabacteria bacterium RIFCSPLOWO2_02_FULL_48_8]OGE95947.1 MAG: type I glyceraldehyde-3-phosphate dehydrogenase [Candidatus Doudnabacteria bacterium RIFCSPHIGHO2_12_FULL_48_11]
MSPIRVAINGFGRIGRSAFKIALTKPELKVAAINDLTEPKVLAHLLRYDSVYGVYEKKVSFDDRHERASSVSYSVGSLIADEIKVPVFAEKDPGLLPWKDLDVDVVLESTGRFVTTELASAHLKAGAKKVIISAPAKDEGITLTFIIGVNDRGYQNQQIISNASCTTNCITPVAAILHSKFGIKKMMMSTIHAYTAEQNLVDGPPPGGKSNDLRRARAASANIIPTTTGATIAATEVIPELKGLFGGAAYRVPVTCGSLSDFTAVLQRKVTVDEINKVFMEAAKNPMWEKVLQVTTDPIVSSDIVGNPHSAIVDLSLTQVVDGDLVKVVAWYDNEFGYANRFVEQAILIGKNL